MPPTMILWRGNRFQGGGLESQKNLRGAQNCVDVLRNPRPQDLSSGNRWNSQVSKPLNLGPTHNRLIRPSSPTAPLDPDHEQQPSFEAHELPRVCRRQRAQRQLQEAEVFALGLPRKRAYLGLNLNPHCRNGHYG